MIHNLCNVYYFTFLFIFISLLCYFCYACIFIPLQMKKQVMKRCTPILCSWRLWFLMANRQVEVWHDTSRMSKSKISFFFLFLIFMVLISASYHFALCLYSAWQKSAWSFSVWWVRFNFSNYFVVPLFYLIFSCIMILFFYVHY